MLPNVLVSKLLEKGAGAFLVIEKMLAKEQQQRYLFLDDSLKPCKVTLHQHLVEDQEKLCS